MESEALKSALAPLVEILATVVVDDPKGAVVGAMADSAGRTLPEQD